MTAPPLLGIEIGGTKLQLGLGAGDGRIANLLRREVDPERGAAGIRHQIREGVAELVRAAGIPSDTIASLGVGFGGPVRAVDGVTIKSNQINGWEQFPLAKWMRDNLGIDRVALQNDADTAALAEARFGAGIGLSPILYVTIGSGIGGGLIIDGRIYRGSGTGAVEIGHLWVSERINHETRLIRLEQIASGWSIGESGRLFVLQAMQDQLDVGAMLRLAEGNPTRVTAQVVGLAAASGDIPAQSIMAKAHEAIGEALAQAVTLLAPRRIILGGGVSLIGEAGWFAPIRNHINSRVFGAFSETFDLVPAALGEEVVVHGALALARDALPTR